MKIVFMGTPDFAAGILEALHAAGHEIAAAVSQPDRPVGRHGLTQPTPVKARAAELGIGCVLQPEKARDPEFIAGVRALDPDVIVVAAYGHILKKELLELPKYGCINVHASLLPRWRGAAPIQWSVIAGDAVSGVSIMQMNEGLDTGDILLQKSLALDTEETGGSLFERLAELGAEAVCEALTLIEEGRAKAVPQPGEGVCYAPILVKEMGNIDWEKDALSIERLVRGLSPWPGTFTYYKGKLLKIHKAAAVTKEAPAGLAAGSLFAEEGKLYAVCGCDVLRLDELQPESRKRMAAADFLRGYGADGCLGKER